MSEFGKLKQHLGGCPRTYPRVVEDAQRREGDQHREDDPSNYDGDEGDRAGRPEGREKAESDPEVGQEYAETEQRPDHEYLSPSPSREGEGCEEKNEGRESAGIDPVDQSRSHDGKYRVAIRIAIRVHAPARGRRRAGARRFDASCCAIAPAESFAIARRPGSSSRIFASPWISLSPKARAGMASTFCPSESARLESSSKVLRIEEILFRHLDGIPRRDSRLGYFYR